MTDRTDHRAAAEGELLNAIGYVHDADLSKADRAYQCINFALIHALLAIHDTLTAADRYAANEAKQREAEPDPLDEDDHRDRVDGNGDIWQRVHEGCWMEPGLPPVFHGPAECLPLTALPGTLTFAPEPPQDATGGDPSTSQGENGAVEQAGGGHV